MDKILLVRGQKAMLDSDLAALYEVETKVLNQAVKRNQQRFPEDFMFQLIAEEEASLRLQFVTSKRGGRRLSVLRVYRARCGYAKDLARQLEAMEKRYDAQFKVVFDALRQLMEPIPSSPKRIGFATAPTKPPSPKK